MSSYVRIPSDKMKELASDVIARIENFRKGVETDFIAKKLESQQNSWWRKLLRHHLKPLTYEQVLANEVAYMAEGGIHSELRRIRTSFWMKEDLAKALVVAAEHSDSVNITVEDLNELMSAPEYRERPKESIIIP